MDDINVKAELAASLGSSNPKVEAAEVPPDDPPSDGLRISSVVSMAASMKSEILLDIVSSAVHEVIKLEP